jgi:hypothetical protein
VAGSRPKVAGDIHTAAAEAHQEYRAVWVELSNVPQNFIHVLKSQYLKNQRKKEREEDGGGVEEKEKEKERAKQSCQQLPPATLFRTTSCCSGSNKHQSPPWRCFPQPPPSSPSS